MKKIASLVLALLTLSALAVPAFAQWFGTGEIPEGTYQSIMIYADSEVTINSSVQLVERSYLNLYGDNITVRIGENGSLTGNSLGLLFMGSNRKIVIEKGGKLDLSFAQERDADAFDEWLTDNKIDFEREENRFIARGCEHENAVRTTDIETTVVTTVTTTTTVVCDHCGYEKTESKTESKTETYKGAPLQGSTFSEGSLTVILCVACAAAFGVGGFLLGKKKQKTGKE